MIFERETHHIEKSETLISLTPAEEKELERLDLKNALNEALLKFREPGTPPSERLRARNETLNDIKYLLGVSGSNGELKKKIERVLKKIN